MSRGSEGPLGRRRFSMASNPGSSGSARMSLARRERAHAGTGVRTGRTVCPGWVTEVVAGMVLPMDPWGMRARLMLAPRWVLALYYGVFFGVVMGLVTGIRDSSVLGGSSPASSKD